MKEHGPKPEGSLEDLSIVIAFEAARLQRRLGVRDDELFAYVNERFQLLECMGTGTFGKVYLAKDCQLSREVALKIMPRGDPEVADREGRMLAALEHRNVVRILGHGQEEDYRWLELELLRGPTLEQWCEGKGRAEILARYLEAGAGLDAAHRRGLVHQDFKPGNVRLHDEGHAVVLDFGLARNAESLDGITAGGSGSPEWGIGGTLLYMARERLLGKPGGAASDQFAFCVALWEALSGERPFGSAVDRAERVAALSGAPRGGHRIPRRLRRVLERGMAPLPGERWRSMSVLLEALEGATKVVVWPWVLLGVLTVSLVVGVWSWVQVHAPELPPAEPPETLRIMMKLAKAHEHHKHVTARDLLLEARPVARREGRQADLIGLAREVAQHLDDEMHGRLAIEAWMVVDTLSRDLGDDELKEIAISRVVFLSGQM